MWTPLVSPFLREFKKKNGWIGQPILSFAYGTFLSHYYLGVMLLPNSVIGFVAQWSVTYNSLFYKSPCPMMLCNK